MVTTAACSGVRVWRSEEYRNAQSDNGGREEIR